MIVFQVWFKTDKSLCLLFEAAGIALNCSDDLTSAFPKLANKNDAVSNLLSLLESDILVFADETTTRESWFMSARISKYNIYIEYECIYLVYKLSIYSIRFLPAINCGDAHSRRWIIIGSGSSNESSSLKHRFMISSIKAMI